MHKLMKTGALALLAAFAYAGAALAWGAIAVDHDYGEDPEDSGYVLISPGHQTPDTAASEALMNCQENGDHCEVLLTFRKCGAYAASRTHYGVGSANTLKDAERRAVGACKARGCRVVVSDCDR